MDAIRFDLNLYRDDNSARQRDLVGAAFNVGTSNAQAIVVRGRTRRHERKPCWIMATPAQFIAWCNARADLKGEWSGLQAHVVDAEPGIDFDVTYAA